MYELEVLEIEIKRNNAMLTKRNKELHIYVLEMRGMYIMLKSRNLRYLDPKTRSLLLYDVNMNCIKSMNEAHKSIRREPNSIDNTHIKTTS